MVGLAEAFGLGLLVGVGFGVGEVAVADRLGVGVSLGVVEGLSSVATVVTCADTADPDEQPVSSTSTATVLVTPAVPARRMLR